MSIKIQNVCSPSDTWSLTPPAGGGERPEGGQGGQPLIRELWFIVVMAAVALLLLAIVLGVTLHKVRDVKMVKVGHSYVLFNL